MSEATVLRKTPRGQEAIAARAHGLVGRMRSLLILVDGQRTQSALGTLAAGFGDVAQMLADLQAAGFIEPVPVSVVVPASTVAPGSQAVSLAQAKAFATRSLMQTLGPTSDALCLRIEAARNRAEFVEAVQRAYAAVNDIRGRARAEAFGAAIENNLPPA